MDAPPPITVFLLRGWASVEWMPVHIVFEILSKYCLKNAFDWEHKLQQHQIFFWVNTVVIFQAF